MPEKKVKISIAESEFTTISKLVAASAGKYNTVEEWLSSAIIEKFVKENKPSKKE